MPSVTTVSRGVAVGFDDLGSFTTLAGFLADFTIFRALIGQASLGLPRFKLEGLSSKETGSSTRRASSDEGRSHGVVHRGSEPVLADRNGIAHEYKQFESLLLCVTPEHFLMHGSLRINWNPRTL